MKLRKLVIRGVLAVAGLVTALVLFTIAAVSVLDRSNGTIVSSGEEREYLLHVPPSHDRSRPTPLVISLHGGAVWPAHQMNTSRWNRLADEHGFIVVYPSGSDVPKTWHVYQGSDLMIDVRFIDELIDELQASYNIDPDRIYADGFSNGGGMAFVLSCTLSHRIAAVGMVAAAQSLPGTWCTDRRPVPMIAFHGTADPFVPYGGGRSPVPGLSIELPGVLTWTAQWARRNRCAAEPVRSAAATGVTRLAYTDCAHGADVVLYTVQGGGHSWPGGKPVPEWIAGPTTREIDATRLMWEFFVEHPAGDPMRTSEESPG